MRVHGVILAGGSGIRMGGLDKGLLALGRTTLMARAVQRLQFQVQPVAISANGDPSRFGLHGLPVLPDAAAMGPLAGILAGLDWALKSGADAIVSVAVDTPFFPDDLVTRLTQGGCHAAIATCNGRAHPTFGLWPVALREHLRAGLARGEAKLMRFADGIGAAQIEFQLTDPDPFWNLNTPEDLIRAVERLRA
jgi:molybdenum cofactor guanylyltransferase